LNSRGQIEAEQVAWYLKSLMTKGSKILVLSSPLKRAVDTSTPFVRMLESDNIHHHFLEVEELHEYQYDTEWDQFWVRVRDIPDILRNLSKDYDCVVVFSHGNLLSCLFQYLMSQETLTSSPKVAVKVFNCSLTIFEEQSIREWRILRLNTIDHLNYDD
jgi:broad specificity phosphatase PhoE